MSVARTLQVAGFATYLRWVRRRSEVSVDLAIKESVLVTYWHDAILCLLTATLGRKEVAIYVRAQPHIEDTLDLLARLGVRTFLADPSSPSTIKAARDWLEVPGRVLGVTLDGSPPRVAMAGAARLARLLKAPLHPLLVSASSGYRRDSWDSGVVPRAGGRLTVRALPAIHSADPDADALELQRALSEPTLLDCSPRERPSWEQRLDFWPRLCLMPVTQGMVRVWPAQKHVPMVNP